MEIKKVLDNVDVIDGTDTSFKLFRLLNEIDALIGFCEYMKKFSYKQMEKTDQYKNEALNVKYATWFEVYEDILKRLEQLKKSI